MASTGIQTARTLDGEEEEWPWESCLSGRISFFEVWAVQPQPAAVSCHSTAPQQEAWGKDGLVPQRNLA